MLWILSSNSCSCQESKKAKCISPKKCVRYHQKSSLGLNVDLRFETLTKSLESTFDELLKQCRPYTDSVSSPNMCLYLSEKQVSVCSFISSQAKIIVRDYAWGSTKGMNLRCTLVGYTTTYVSTYCMCLRVFWRARVLLYVLHICLHNVQCWKDTNKIIRISHK